MRTDIPIGDLLRGKQRVRVWKRKKLDLAPLTIQQRGWKPVTEGTFLVRNGENFP